MFCDSNDIPKTGNPGNLTGNDRFSGVDSGWIQYHPSRQIVLHHYMESVDRHTEIERVRPCVVGLEWRPVLVEGLHADHRHCHVVGPQVKDCEHSEQSPHQTRGER